MKLSCLAVQEAPEAVTTPAQQKIRLPAGLIGFADFTEAEIVYKSEELPFMWLKGTGANKFSFIVVEPAGLIRDYEMEISDTDTEVLGIKSPAEAMILNIATLHKGQNSQKSRITLNLVGPVIINRQTLKARQVILNNAQKYSANHLLFESSAR